MEFKLIIKKLNNTLTNQEEDIFNLWYQESDKHRNYFDHVKENYSKDLDIIDIEKGWYVIQKQIKPALINSKYNYWKYTVAGSVMLLISITFMFNKDKASSIEVPLITNEIIKPGTDKAILTFEDGTEVALEKGHEYTSGNLKSNGKDLVYAAIKEKVKDISYNYLTIPRGGQYHVKLTDGTEVWLNSESQIKYPVAFIEGETRQVELIYGEAIFDVSHSTEHQGSKFKVQTKTQEIEVLGTLFNISAFKGENTIYTTLVKGKVAVSHGIQHAILNPSQQSIIKPDAETIQVIDINVYNVISWREGIFSFENFSLEKITQVLSRWYDVDILFSNAKLKEEHFTGILRKNQKIEDILNTIKTINNISYEINNKTIILK